MIDIVALREQNENKPWLERTLFISGRLSLDFAQSGGEGEYKVFERLHTPEDLAAWLAMSELSLERAVASRTDVRLAHELRGALWRTANALRGSDAPLPKDIATINNMAATTPLVPVLDQYNVRKFWQQPVSAQSALATIARDAIELFSQRANLPIRQCAGAHCPLLFIDSSRPGKRKWCSMERCGNRAKIVKYRNQH